MARGGAVADLQAGPTASRPTFRWIQVLRAVAALMVVAHHATILLFQRDGLVIQNWIAGSSGVDLFFIISGFVMTISSAPLQVTRHPARTFLARRIERIVPLYWLLTSVKVLLLLLLPAVALNGLGSAYHVWSSYLFWPTLSAEGRFEPVLVVGWTLNFEFAFYLAFAAALAGRKQPLWVVTPWLALLPLLPLGWILRLPVSLQFFHNTVLWEFAFGMLLARFVGRVRHWPPQVGLLLVIVGLIPLLTWNTPGVSYWRGVLWGVPAFAVVLGAVVMEKRWGRHSPRWTLELGDASYSTYLVHTFVLPVIGIWLLHWRHGWPLEIATALVAALLGSALAGEVLYRTIELPVLRTLKGRRRTAVPANA